MPTISASTRWAEAELRDALLVLRLEVRRHLEKQRDRAARRRQGRQQAGEGVALLERAQSGSVRRGDVDGHVVGERRERLQAATVVGGGVGGVAVHAHVDTDHPHRTISAGEARRHGSDAIAVEAEPVDDRPVGREAEQTRLRIALLRARGHRPDFDKGEALPQQRRVRLCVLVEAGREPDRVRQVEPGERGAQTRQLGQAAAGQPRQDAQRRLVSRLRRQQMQ